MKSLCTTTVFVRCCVVFFSFFLLFLENPSLPRGVNRTSYYKNDAMMLYVRSMVHFTRLKNKIGKNILLIF